MFTPVYSKQFAIDIKKAQKQGKNLEKFKTVAKGLLEAKVLDKIYKDHRLIGNYTGRKEYHIESDWLLIDKMEETQVIFERIGSHSNLFKK